MNPMLLVVCLTVGLFIGILACLEIGLRIGRYYVKKASETPDSGSGIVDAAVFGLLGLLIGFSFSGAASRLDAKRTLITQEANAIGTAYLRLDLLPPDAQPELRRMFREYLDVRLRTPNSMAALESERAELNRRQGEIWSHAEAACRQEQWQPASLLLLPAINEMIDITTTREMAARTHMPSVIILLLFVVALLAGLLAGYAMSTRKKRSVLHMVLFALVVTASIYVTLDLEYPHIGIIRLDAADQILRQLRDTIK